MKKFIRISVLWVVGICFAAPLFAGKLITSFQYGKYGPIATGATMIDEETGNVIWEGKLKSLNAEKRILVLEEEWHSYTLTKDWITGKDLLKEDVYAYEVTRDLFMGRRLTETIEGGIPEDGKYKTTYKYGEYVIVPDKAVTNYIDSGKTEFSCVSELIRIVPKENNQGWLEIKETHYKNGKISFQAIVKRDIILGSIFDEDIIRGKREVNYQTWFLNKWPCGTW